jgi:hypothetical protein
VLLRLPATYAMIAIGWGIGRFVTSTSAFLLTGTLWLLLLGAL